MYEVTVTIEDGTDRPETHKRHVRTVEEAHGMLVYWSRVAGDDYPITLRVERVHAHAN